MPNRATMCWSAPLSDSVTIDPRTAPEACASMAEVRQGVDALDRAIVTLLAAYALIYSLPVVALYLFVSWKFGFRFFGGIKA